MLAGAADRVVLRVTPAIPCAFHSRLNQVEPLLFSRIVRRRRQREQLPSPFIANQRHNRLAARPSYMPIRPRVVGIVGHQPLLNRKDKIVRGVQGRGRHWRIVAAESDLKSADRLEQRLGRFRVIAESKRLNIIQ